MAPDEFPDLQPHPERVTDAYAEERIREKIGLYEARRPQVGLRNVDNAMREAGVPPAWRLHYITAVAHLGKLASREGRLRSDAPREAAGEPLTSRAR